MAGFFITLEGGEGAGKSTAIAVIRAWLERHGRAGVFTREPGGTPPAERIRQLLLDPETGDIAPLTELLLMFAARNENLVQVIRPALAAGQVVVSDRFTDASLAYQGGGRELGRDPVEALAALVHHDLRPDLTLLLDVPVDIGMARITRRSGGPDRFEQAHGSFLKRVRAAYLEQARREPARFALIDAAAPIEQVSAEIEQVLEERLT